MFEEAVVYESLFLQTVVHVFGGYAELFCTAFYRHYSEVYASVGFDILSVHGLFCFVVTLCLYVVDLRGDIEVPW